ncbi:MAG TPA: OmpA family protein [Stellaceae bacterium]|jgi:outer membrane protein OmpA-like peptidoglycan-associated protein|nr:OmpA family protein [Stellaceae bacterium]
MKTRYLLGAGVALAVALSWADAQAQWLAMPSGPGSWYLGGEGGWTSLESPQTGNIGGAKFSQSFSDKYNVGGRAGYEWGPWRFEEEFRFQQNGDTRASIAGAGIGTNGNRNAYAFMTNAIYDFTFGWPVTPHIGAGIGAVNLHDSWGIPKVGTVAHSSDTEFGYQAIAGIRYNINPALAFDIDYRYLATTDASFHSAVGPTYTSGYSTHSLVASLSLRFGAAPPPPVAAPPLPPPPPVASHTVYLVFFDWDKDTITPEGMQIVRQAADKFKMGGSVTIQVTGYTDRSGSPGYNQRLSERRANNVANAMARMGVPRQAMAVSGRGENDNRVPTAPGVREPQNRRVEIVFP